MERSSVPVMEYKQVLVIRSDIGMSKGKAIAQAAHASVNAALDAQENIPDFFTRWMGEGYRKIACKVDGEDAILRLEQEAREAGIPVAVIRDFGLTELKPGTITAIGIGPAPETTVDSVTGRLKLV